MAVGWVWPPKKSDVEAEPLLGPDLGVGLREKVFVIGKIGVVVEMAKSSD